MHTKSEYLDDAVRWLCNHNFDEAAKAARRNSTFLHNHIVRQQQHFDRTGEYYMPGRALKRKFRL